MYAAFYLLVFFLFCLFILFFFFARLKKHLFTYVNLLKQMIGGCIQT